MSPAGYCISFTIFDAFCRYLFPKLICVVFICCVVSTMVGQGDKKYPLQYTGTASNGTLGAQWASNRFPWTGYQSKRGHWLCCCGLFCCNRLVNNKHCRYCLPKLTANWFGLVATAVIVSFSDATGVAHWLPTQVLGHCIVAAPRVYSNDGVTLTIIVISSHG